MTVLAGDIGATTSRLALVDRDGDALRVSEREEYASAEFAGLAEVVERYLRGIEDRPERAALGVAAPVVDGRARFANLDWEVDSGALAGRIGIGDLHLLNDFEALCHALPLLGADDTVEILGGAPDPAGPVAVLGAGSGLGHGFVTRGGGEERVHSSEAGHADFGPRSATQDALLRWLRGRHGRASYERVLSGPGLVDILRFLVETGRAAGERESAAVLESDDAPAAVSDRALDGADPACERALEIFVEVYGAQAGNFAMAVQATGGVYLGGGIAPKVLPALDGDAFRRAFLDKGKMAPMMREIPVRVVTARDAGLLGAARAVLG